MLLTSGRKKKRVSPDFNQGSDKTKFFPLKKKKKKKKKKNKKKVKEDVFDHLF